MILAIVLVALAIPIATGAFSAGGPEDQGKDEAAVSSAAGGDSDQGAQPNVQSEPVTINLMMVGDILQHTRVYQSGLQADGSYNFDHVYAHMASAMEGQDIKVLNQETPLGGASLGYSGYPAFNGPQEMGDAEVKAGFNVVLKATNHAMDRGYDGIHNEQEYWKAKHPDIAVLGEIDPLSDNPGSLDDVYIYEKDGFKVALLNYTYGLNGFADPKGAVAQLDEDRIKRNVQSARDQGADIVVAFPHWGIEYQTTASDDQRKWAEVFRKAGVDVIIGGHPHILEPVEVLSGDDGHQTLCYWSVGNFICTQSDDSMIGGMAKVQLRKESDGTAHVVSYSLDPLVINKGAGRNMTTYLASDWTSQMATSSAVPTLTPAHVDSFCSRVLGSGYDSSTHQLKGTMDGAGQDDGGDEALPDAA